MKTPHLSTRWRRTSARLALLLTGLLLGSPLGCGDPSSLPRDKAPAKAAANHQTPAPRSVTLALNWFPEAEHGGYYAALVENLYRDAGLDVKILPGGPEAPVIQQVARGQVDFGVTNADNILFGRAAEAPVVALMAPMQISPRCLIVHEKSGIRHFDQLRNITIAMSNSAAFYHYLRHKVPLEGVKIVPYPGSIAPFLLQADYAQQGYVFSEPYLIRKQGGDPRVLMLADLGFNPYTSVLITSEKLLAADRPLAAKMVAASVRGWARYLEAPQATNQEIHRLNPAMDLDVLANGARELKPLVLDKVAKQQGLGTMSAARWRTLGEQLVEIGQLEASQIHTEQAFTDKLLEAKGR